jgi:hypothetical protein
MSLPFDATLKEIVSQAPADFQLAFHLSTAEPVRSLNVDLSTISAVTDVALGFGEPLTEIVDLNFQSGPDSTVDARLHLYNAMLHLKYGVPIRSILVLLRPKADRRQLKGRLSYTSGDRRVRFEYDVVRLWRQPLQSFLEGGVGLLPLATLCKMPAGMPMEQSLHAVVHEIDQRLAALPDHAQAVRLMSAAFTLASSRFSKDTTRRIFEGVTIMHKPTLWDEVEEKQMQWSKRLLLRVGRKKFGDPDRKDETAFNKIKELARLDRMIDAIFEANSWKELLAVR